jgi:hypothetical protein
MPQRKGTDQDHTPLDCMPLSTVGGINRTFTLAFDKHGKGIVDINLLLEKIFVLLAFERVQILCHLFFLLLLHHVVLFQRVGIWDYQCAFLTTTSGGQ